MHAETFYGCIKFVVVEEYPRSYFVGTETTLSSELPSENEYKFCFLHTLNGDTDIFSMHISISFLSIQVKLEN